ncbi:MAG: RtcB family protein [Bacillota bacterium]|nr:RtcB family protein [Bacillota bacterium]
MQRLVPAGKNCYKIERQSKMKAHVVVYLNKSLYESFSEDQALQQLIDAASLPGVVSPVVGMPDIHTGFGLPIGGVMAMDREKGLISAGAVGMDINCGVRLLQTNIEKDRFNQKSLRELMAKIEKQIPSGVGRKSRHSEMIRRNFEGFIHGGVPYMLELGMGRPEDANFIEERGFMPGADIRRAGKKAIDRGLQLSTIGGGNHFIEIGYVEEIFDHEASVVYGLEKEKITILIHTGSRGFGHQICTDYSAVMKKAAAKYGLEIPSAGLAAVPINSKEGRDYLAAMACAVNFAFCNRQWITDDIRKAFVLQFGGDDRAYDLGVVYDVAHNTARFEDVGGRIMLVHRKGATRALPPRHCSNPDAYRKTGHPAIIPGSMGTASYIIRAEYGVEQIFNSVNHGAGRVMSRTAARRSLTVEQLKEKLSGIMVSGRSYKAYLDEAPQAYKDIEAVVGTFSEIGMCKKVARLRPLAVIKGEGKDN